MAWWPTLRLAARIRPAWWRPSLDRVTTPLAIAQTTADQLASLRKVRLQVLVQANRATLDRDGEGQPVRRNELVVTDPDPAALSASMRAGFRMIGDENVGELGLRIVTLAPPKRHEYSQAMKALRRAAPTLEADYNHVYEPAGGALLPATTATLASAPSIPSQYTHRHDRWRGCLASIAGQCRNRTARIRRRRRSRPATARRLGRLLVGEQGPFRGAARGAQLFVGDVYGGNPAAGSATTIVRALAWAASKRPAVINISLVGPSNRTMARAIAALRARGIAARRRGRQRRTGSAAAISGLLSPA